MWDHGREPNPLTRVSRPWRKALNTPDAAQVRHAKDLLHSRPYFDRVPDQSVIGIDPGRGALHLRSTRDRRGTYVLV